MRHRVTVIFTVIMLFTISSAFAKGLKLGVKGGLNFTSFHGDPWGWESKTRFCAGLFVNFRINKVFAFRPEILYTQKGAKHSFWQWQIIEETVKLSYLEIPILIKITEPTPGMFKPNLFVGPYFGYNLIARRRTEIDGQLEEEVDIDEDTKDLDLGIILGGGADVVFPFGTIVLDGRYGLGLITTDEEGRHEVKNKVISFMLGYSLRL